ncbi:MAG: acetyl-CoA carboxylase biotin carboxyl carrier protein [Alphaproteobacteria bacterium]
MTQFDEKLVKKLAVLLNETDLSDIEVETEGWRIKVGRSKAETIHVAAPVAAAAPAAAPIAIAAAPADHPGAVKSPMVGVAYHAAEPGADPFVEVGDKIKKGQTILIIEAMKIMNQIKAEKEGTVKEIFAENGQPVEFGEPLLIIE